ncbi:MAG: glycine--tRNA ligase [Candidatus Omnitrophica bacterium]|nr:glycine--tRNA ligase [Candidatus Omnitrophota bacterium]MCF7891908.1 glycine--tRNA ligase [Candidatus Omnitrophota bacterium]MCF7895422.1 glycine--tRNA ligase [Candidatus Omnitrophota bacterium]MCF7897933.1 glycine--tRNA ligase [Candidatus Omnitrophota bacterium]MCF7909629.1 glycine--tRNA ligase [Candidatus Omnitrophota bacterium]
MANDKLTQIISLCKRRGFIFGGSQIYGGLSSIWDYGPLGASIKKKIKDIWWKRYVDEREDIVGLDSGIIMSEGVFLASGHLKGFSDQLVDCSSCGKRFRVDKIEKVEKNIYKCPECGNQIDIGKNPPRQFNLMLKTNMSAAEDQPYYGYLRPETAQGIFVNFSNVLNTSRKKLPLGIAQIGKAFRNEVTTGSFIFRMKEFEQMEIEYFVRPEKANEFYDYWVKERYDFYLNSIGLNKENLRLRNHSKEELAHYAKTCTDIEFNFPFGWSELEGVANRGDYDLTKHAQESGKDLSYFDAKTKEKIIPYVIEPSAGVDRTFFAVISDAFCQEEVKGRKRTVLKLKPHLAPYQVAIFPLLKKNPELVKLAKNIFCDIKNKVPAVYDDTASIGKLYRRQDEIGTPFCVTVDVDSLDDKKVTVRNRDSMAQDRISIDKVLEFISDKLG